MPSAGIAGSRSVYLLTQASVAGLLASLNKFRLALVRNSKTLNTLVDETGSGVRLYGARHSRRKLDFTATRFCKI